MNNATAYPLLIVSWKGMSLESRIADERQSLIRRVMAFYWVFHIVVTVLLAFFVVNEKYSVLMSTFLIILQLNIIKIYESLNNMYSKAMAVETVSTSMIEYMQGRFLKCLESKQQYLECVEHVSSDIIKDLREFETEMKWYWLLLYSFLWKVPRHAKYITEKDFAKEAYENVLNGGYITEGVHNF